MGQNKPNTPVLVRLFLLDGSDMAKKVKLDAGLFASLAEAKSGWTRVTMVKV
jgi:hypothetical protein